MKLMRASSDRVPNVLLVVFDTLRLDAVGCYGTPPPWGAIETPILDAFARESVRFTRAYPESLPTLCARRALYTGQRTYPFHDGDFRLKGDFPGVAPGWGPIPEAQHTLAEIFQAAGFRTGLIADVYHMFKPSKNFWRGFDQWTFIRGQETDAARSGPGAEPGRCSTGTCRAACRRPAASRGRSAKLPTGIDWFSTRVRPQHARPGARGAVVQRPGHAGGRALAGAEPGRRALLPDRRVVRSARAVVRARALPAPATTRRTGRSRCSRPTPEIPDLEPELVRRTRANYAGLVTMCDRWLGHLLETLRTQGRLDDTLVVVASDHGHTLWERRAYIGKRGYPSDPEVYDVPLLVRHPAGLGAGTTCDAWVQHHDVAATLLEAAGVPPPAPLAGRSVWRTAFAGGPPVRDHAVVGWGSAITVVTERWWFNCKVDGRGAFLFDRKRTDPFAENLADAEPALVRELFAAGVAEAAGGFPGYVLELAQRAIDAPGCSPIAVG